MTKVILDTDRKHSYNGICCPDMLKTYQKETKLFKFSRDTNRKELKIKKNDFSLLFALHFSFFLFKNFVLKQKTK